MDKKILAAIPPRPATDEEMVRLRLSDDCCYFFRADLHTADLLVLTVYHAEIAKTNSTRPFLTVYFSRADFINSMFVEEENQHKWYTACLHRYFKDWCSKSLMDMESKQAIADFFASSDHFMKAIDRFQERVLADRLTRKHQRITDAIDQNMALVPALPKQFEELVATKAMPQRYMFYTYARKKVIVCFCTNCRGAVMVNAPRHNRTGKCPACGATVLFVSRGRCSAGKYDEAVICLPQKLRDGFVLRYFEAWRTESPDGMRSVEHKEIQRDLYRGNDVCRYSYGDFKYTGTIRWCDCTHDLYYYHGYLYPGSLTRIMAGTVWQYSSLALYPRTTSRPTMGWYLHKYTQHPWIENLLKNGLYRLVNDILQGYYSNRMLNLRKTKIHEVLGVGKEIFRLFKAMNGGNNYLGYAQEMEREGFAVRDAAMLKDVCEVWGKDRRKYVQGILPYTSYGKAMRYSKRLDQAGREDWLDYVEMAAEVGYNLRREHALFPRDLKAAHDTVTLLHREMAAKADEEAFAPLAIRMKQLEWQADGSPYRVVAPRHAIDIVHEGHQLNHCVHHYIKKVIGGECEIMFLRRTAEPDKPYVTLEIQNQRVQQYQGWDNELPDREARAFVDTYGRWLRDGMKQPVAA